MAEAATKIANLEAERSRRFLRDLRNHPFIAVVIYGDGSIKVFDKSIGPDEVDRVREALEERLSERMIDGSENT